MLGSIGNDNVSTLDSTDKDDVSMTNDLKFDDTAIVSTQSDVMMASFRIDRQLWVKFGAIAKRERLTATDVLTDYIQRCTDKDKTEYAVSIDTEAVISTDTYNTDKLNDAVMMAVSTMSLLSKDDVSMMISMMISKAQDEFNTEWVETNSKISTERERLNIVNRELASLKAEIEPITKTITELETRTRERFEKLEARSIAAPIAIPTPIPAKLTDEVNKTWVEFFKMVGIDALTASEAQKKGNTNTRTKQIEEGLIAAKEQGLGEWAVKVAGRLFVRIGD
jgi:protein involved in ribonucleotide reduction